MGKRGGEGVADMLEVIFLNSIAVFFSLHNIIIDPFQGCLVFTMQRRGNIGPVRLYPIPVLSV